MAYVIWDVRKNAPANKKVYYSDARFDSAVRAIVRKENDRVRQGGKSIDPYVAQNFIKKEL